MNKIIPITSVISLFLFSGCGISPIKPPTPTATPSLAFTSTLTLPPTATMEPTSTPTSTPPKSTAGQATTPAPACLPANGKWESKETAEVFGMPSPILTFTVGDCRITAWDIWVYPAPGELLPWTGSSAIVITDNHFSWDEDTGDGIFTFEGTFDTATSSHGTLDFPKGFSVFGTILKKAVSIPWTAAPAD